jgi:hypothetical protein
MMGLPHMVTIVVMLATGIPGSRSQPVHATPSFGAALKAVEPPGQRAEELYGAGRI